MRDLFARIGRERATVREQRGAHVTLREVAVVGARDALSGGSPHIDGPDATEVRCHCGAVLADRIDGMTVVIDRVEFQFRRRTDMLKCPDCGHRHPCRQLRPGTQPEPHDSGQRRRRDDR